MQTGIGKLVLVGGIAVVIGFFLGSGVFKDYDEDEQENKMKVELKEIVGGPGVKATDAEVPQLDNATQVRQSKITLIQALDYAEAKYGPQTEAKFELDDAGKLSLSLYPVGKGINTDAARNVLQELAGDPTVIPWAPELSTFTDEEHLKIGSRDLTIVQTAGLSLREAIERVNEKQPGFVYFAIPTIRDGQPGYGIYTLDSYDKSHYFFVN